MNARKLVEVAGVRLLGRTVLTEGLGYYPSDLIERADRKHLDLEKVLP
jgi:hypothetical protein